MQPVVRMRSVVRAFLNGTSCVYVVVSRSIVQICVPISLVSGVHIHMSSALHRGVSGCPEPLPPPPSPSYKELPGAHSNAQQTN